MVIKMKNVEMFYFDVDGTLLDNDTHVIPESTINALNTLKSAGYLVGLCTGRNYQGIVEANIHDLIEWDGYVLANGSLLLDKERNVVEEIFISAELIKLLDAHVSGPLLLEGKENFITKEPNKPMLRAFKHFGIPNVYPVKKYEAETIYNLICYNFDELLDEHHEFVKIHAKTMLDQLGNTEMIPILSGKDYGVSILNKHLDVKLYAGFGDGENDIDFLMHAPFSVAMGDAVEGAKKVAMFTSKSVLEDGIEFALKHYGVL